MTKYLLILTIGIFIFSSCTDQKEHRKQQFVLKASEAYKNQNYNQAIHYLEEAIMIDSCYSAAMNNLATVYYKQGDLDKALHLYEQALMCDPNFYPGVLNLSNTLYDLKQYYRGLDVLNKQVALTPDSAELYFAMGLHLTRLRDYDSAEVVFNVARKYDPDNVELLINLGTIKYYLNDLEKAEGLLRRALSLDPKQAEAYNTLALIASAQGNHSSAVQYIDQALEIREEPHFLNNKGYFLIELGNIDQAVHNINESILMDPLNAWAFRNKAIVRLTQDQPDEALVLLDRAAKLDDWVEDLNFYYGQAWIQKGNQEKACSYFSKGTALKEKKSVEAFNKLCE